jgi:hypothetical protein
MKKTLMTCLAIIAVFAIASTAVAVTCTIDQRPAATLLVPYFQVSYDSGGELISTGPDARDTIVTIANASAAPMIAHVNIYSRESLLLLDFNIALTGFDVQAMRMSDVLGGILPSSGDTIGFDVCQRNALANVYPDPDGFMRVRPLAPATGNDNSLATTDYPVPAFGTGFGLIEDLRLNCDGGLDDLAIGYIMIDHVNYCNLSDPTDPAYFTNDAIGMENNLWGEIIFTSGTGIPTYGLSTVNVEADSVIGNISQGTTIPMRTLYARYWNFGDNSGDFPPGACPNCGSGDPETDLLISAPWDIGYGDQREPLGLRWAARWFDLDTTITSNFRVWRLSPTGGDCIFNEPTVTLTFFDEDENTVTQGVCPSPCTQPTFNFPLETQQRNISDFSHPTAVAGWVNLDFVNFASGDVWDQAWVDYSFESNVAFETILVPGTQLDPSTCNPLGYEFPASAFVFPDVPQVPIGTGVGGS